MRSPVFSAAFLTSSASCSSGIVGHSTSANPASRAICKRSATLMPLGSISNSTRSEEHTSELQSPCNLVCRLLLEKKKREADNDIYADCDLLRSLGGSAICSFLTATQVRCYLPFHMQIAPALSAYLLPLRAPVITS